jgi:hypothetical protein
LPSIKCTLSCYDEYLDSGLICYDTLELVNDYQHFSEACYASTFYTENEGTKFLQNSSKNSADYMVSLARNHNLTLENTENLKSSIIIYTYVKNYVSAFMVQTRSMTGTFMTYMELQTA